MFSVSVKRYVSVSTAPLRRISTESELFVYHCSLKFGSFAEMLQKAKMPNQHKGRPCEMAGRDKVCVFGVSG